MKVKELSELFLLLEQWARKNKDKVNNPIRTKHFLEDMAYILHWLDDEKYSPKVQQWRNESIPKFIIKIFGLKEKPFQRQEEAGR